MNLWKQVFYQVHWAVTVWGALQQIWIKGNNNVGRNIQFSELFLTFVDETDPRLLMLLLPEDLFVLFLIWHQSAAGNYWTKPKIDRILGLLHVPSLSENRGSAGTRTLGLCGRENSRWSLKPPWVTWLQGENSPHWETEKLQKEKVLLHSPVFVTEAVKLLWAEQRCTLSSDDDSGWNPENNFPRFPWSIFGHSSPPEQQRRNYFQGASGKMQP